MMACIITPVHAMKTKIWEKKKERPTGHTEDVTVSVYGGKWGAGANSSGRLGPRGMA